MNEDKQREVSKDLYKAIVDVLAKHGVVPKLTHLVVMTKERSMIEVSDIPGNETVAIKLLADCIGGMAVAANKRAAVHAQADRLAADLGID